jgi:DNA-binding MarR family transcriptional regulator
MALLTRLARQVYRRTPEEVLGMRLKPFAVLSTLRDHGDMPQQALGEAMCIDANNLVLLLNELEVDGYAERHRDPADRRRHIVTMTPAGAAQLARSETALENVEDSVLANLDARQRGQLHLLLKQAVDG